MLIYTAVNFMDATAIEIETLESLLEQLRDASVRFHLAAVKGPVLDQLKRRELWEHFDEGQLHFTTYGALQGLGYVGE